MPKTQAITEELKSMAEVYDGDQVCREKFSLLLAELGFPDGLLAVQDIQECGYAEEIGFVWLKLKKKMEHKIENILVSYDNVVTAYVEPNKIKNLTGVKVKPSFFWLSLTEIYADDNAQGSVITFKSIIGLSMSFPWSMFQAEFEKEELMEYQ
ncbi:hypothetical protein Fmac_013368 [Flemingia macrophylla]|uniref:Uncharacterized protein n=1 Tax=Flemingia macrophylla TaxID=520843 RepID=A0ABD1MSY0_9FABA